MFLVYNLLQLTKNINMKITGNTILITGGGSGIGLETARKFASLGNKVIIAGRDMEKLTAAAETMNNLSVIQCDVTVVEDLNALIRRVNDEFSDLNVLINNSGAVHQFSLAENTNVYEGARKEMEVNYLAPIRLTEKLLPLLKSKTAAAIINVTSIVAIVPWTYMPTYSASKAALQAYTRLLRLSLDGSPVRVFEILPPLTDTDFAKDIPTEKMHPEEIAKAILEGIEADEYQVRIGYSEHFYNVNKESPEKALKALNGLS
jgi:uncharacterized oxidoreductase